MLRSCEAGSLPPEHLDRSTTKPNDAMSETPRLRSAYPASPRSSQNARPAVSSAASASHPFKGAPLTPNAATSDEETPLIPFEVLDGPSQRISVAAAFTSLILWRLYDRSSMDPQASESFWLFLKWVAIDSCFVFGLPRLRVPWLQWSPSVTYIIFLVLASLDAILMFDIGLPWQSWLIALTKYLYDRELAIDEVRVKRGNILHNSSLILGRQIVNILPEGSASLNPGQTPLCIDHSGGSVELPIVINQTNPILIEFLRLDLESIDSSESIYLQGKDLRKLRKRAEKEHTGESRTEPWVLRNRVSKPGLYRLQRVVDESKLEVQRQVSDTLVVECPRAYIKPVPCPRCKGDLSDFSLVVRATPPSKVKFSKRVNKQDSGNTLLTVHPDDFVSPLTKQTASYALMHLDRNENADVSWARSQSTFVPLNESLSISGNWLFAIDEVQDALGNVVSYASQEKDRLQNMRYIQDSSLRQVFEVKDRPTAQFEDCSPERGLKVEKGKSKELWLHLSPSPRASSSDPSYEVSYSYRPFRENGGDDTEQDILTSETRVSKDGRGLMVSKPGLYSLLTVSADGCQGEVLEPSSCLLTNPPEPSLDIVSETIPDVCAKKSVGLSVNLELTGTPPFRVSYRIRTGWDKVEPEVKEIHQLHSQLELKPSQEGHYVYEFLELSDAIYREPKRLQGPQYTLEQDVKPGLDARFTQRSYETRKKCLNEPLWVDLEFRGEGPWHLDYEVIHNGQRRKQQETDIISRYHLLDVGPATTGGTYVIALTAVTDSTGCRIPLGGEAQIQVSQSQPKAAFGKIDGAYKVAALEGSKIKLPLRMQGVAPWFVAYVNDQKPDLLLEATLRDHNAHLEVQGRGTYSLVEVYDALCPGTVTMTARDFNIEWIARPTVDFAISSSVKRENGIFIKSDICEADQDTAEVTFTGTPPFYAEYDQRLRPQQGAASTATKKINVGLHNLAVPLDTAKAGLHEYEFKKLEDSTYSHDARKFSRVMLQQRVHPLPSASFLDARKIYKHCLQGDLTGEAIPIMLSGSPPFSIEIAVKQNPQAEAEIVNIPYIDGQRYDFQIPHRAISLGTQAVSIEKVRDGRGCQRVYGRESPTVRVSVADIPNISPNEDKSDYCVGEYLAYTLSGTPPFTVYYSFEGRARKASAATLDFRRVAEKPGVFTITGLSDQKSTESCKAQVSLVKTVHQMPSVRVSKGRTSTVDIHEGGVAEILFEFGGTPPFEFT